MRARGPRSPPLALLALTLVVWALLVLGLSAIVGLAMSGSFDLSDSNARVLAFTVPLLAAFAVGLTILLRRAWKSRQGLPRS